MAEKSPDDELRALHRLVQQAALHGYPNPDRTGCPGIRILEEVAATPAPFKHPAYEHIKTCSPCLAEMLDLRKQRIQAERSAAKAQGNVDGAANGAPSMWNFTRRRPRQWVWAAVFAMVLVIVAFTVKLLVQLRDQNQSAVRGNNNQVAVIDRTIDLWDLDTLRGGGNPVPLKSVSLPATARIRVRVILPRFSESGEYTIAVTRDKRGTDVLAKNAGPAIANGSREVVTVMLDLRQTPPGDYFLQTTQGDEASYYYPLHVH